MRLVLGFVFFLSHLLMTTESYAQQHKAEDADWVFTGGSIYTLDPAHPLVTAIAVKGKKIVALGSEADLKKWQGPRTRLFALKGRAMYPGFHEGHGHLLGIGLMRQRLDLTGLTQLSAIGERVKKAAQETPKDRWLLGRGWDQNLWDKKEFPSRRDLDAWDKDHPIVLTRVDGHAIWANSAALKVAGLTRQTPDPMGGKIIRDAQGEPTGIFLDQAMELVRRQIPAESRAQKRKALEEAMALEASLGITTFHDAGIDTETLSIYEEMQKAGQLTIRLNAMLAGDDPVLLDRYLPRGPQVLGDHRLMIQAVKLMADGALGSRGAALLEPYRDQPQEQGLEILTEEQIFKLSQRFAAAGFQTATHAIGDRSNRSVLNAYERVLKQFKDKDLRLRIEHAQILDATDIQRFGQLGIIASMQPTHLTSDAPWVPTRLGQERMDEGAYVWQKLLKTKALLVGGSDAPVEDPNPLLGIYAAITRQDIQGQPPGGWSADQRLSLDEALAMYTRNAAYAAFLDKVTGQLQVGKAADLVVLSQDLATQLASPRAILHNKVELTMVGGTVIYEK